jgi:hypothetical protein
MYLDHTLVFLSAPLRYARCYNGGKIRNALAPLREIKKMWFIYLKIAVKRGKGERDSWKSNKKLFPQCPLPIAQ